MHSVALRVSVPLWFKKSPRAGLRPLCDLCASVVLFSARTYTAVYINDSHRPVRVPGLALERQNGFLAVQLADEFESATFVF